MLKKSVELVRKDPKKYETGPNKLFEETNPIPDSIVSKIMQEAYHEVFNIENIGAHK